MIKRGTFSKSRNKASSSSSETPSFFLSLLFSLVFSGDRSFFHGSSDTGSNRRLRRHNNTTRISEITPYSLPHQDIQARRRLHDRRRHLLDRRRIKLRRLEPRRLRQRYPPSTLQAQQLLQLRPPIEHLRKQIFGIPKKLGFRVFNFPG
ncbi:hypothetical protein LINPERHAP2_LOCUS34847 [Linum perenne]